MVRMAQRAVAAVGGVEVAGAGGGAARVVALRGAVAGVAELAARRD